MLVDPIIVTAALALLAVMGGLLLMIYRSFVSGTLHPRSTVPREDYEAERAIRASYAAGFASLTDSVDKLADSVDRVAPPNGVG